MKEVIDLAITYKFLKNLVTPFEKWPAYKLGLIDKNGNILKPRRERLKQEEKDALGYFDVVTLNLRKLLGKLPGGQSAIATYAAALLLLKEYPKKQMKEGFEPSEQQVAFMLQEVMKEIEETDGMPTNNTSGIAGLRPDSIGVKKKAMIRYKKANQKLAPSRLGKRFVNFVAEEERKPRTAKALIYQTDVYGAKAYHAKCVEPNCEWQSKRYDKITHAQAAAKKHGHEHFKLKEGE